MTPALESTDAKNKLEDLSGVVIQPGENPYHALITACKNDPAEVQTLYSTHRVTRNSQQREKFLAADFKELIIDPFLLRIAQPEIDPTFSDPRNCLVFWARPPDHVVKLAAQLQVLLKQAAPNLWLMPPHRMHMTTLEVTHSRTPTEIDDLVQTMKPSLPSITSFTYAHRARLVKPLLSYDLAAVAVTFLPAAGELVVSPAPVLPETALDVVDDTYSYHHLRRDVFDMAKAAGVLIDSRYVVPSAHITLGRYLTQEDHATPDARAAWVAKIDEINVWLEQEVWDSKEAEYIGEWIVGQERGLDARSGQLWYGMGRSIVVGEGF